MFDGKTYILVQLLRQNYPEAVALCMIDKSLLKRFALGFIERHKSEVCRYRTLINSEAWSWLVRALEEADTQDGQVTFQVLSAILNLDTHPSLIKAIQVLELHFLRTDILAYAERIRSKGWLREALSVIKRGAMINKELMSANYNQHDPENRQKLIKMDPDAIGNVVYCDLVHP